VGQKELAEFIGPASPVLELGWFKKEQIAYPRAVMKMLRSDSALWAIMLGTAIISSAGFTPTMHTGGAWSALTCNSASPGLQVTGSGFAGRPVIALRDSNARVTLVARRPHAGVRMCGLDTGVLSAVGAVLPRFWLTTLGTVSSDHLGQMLFVGSNIGYSQSNALGNQRSLPML
jgi:hypothetical protein